MTLPLLRRRRLSEAESAGADERSRPGLMRVLPEGTRLAAEEAEATEEEEGRALKQMKKSPAPPEELRLGCG